MHRVNSKKNSDAMVMKPAILLQHGILSSSETYILNGEDSAAFKFADDGYDIWLGNNRGSIYSRKHETLDADKVCDQEQFFDYSFVELGKYDAPAQIDYILEQTGNEKLTYVGHSQGTS